ncbi:hypothetical protein, partial [Pseudonocardia charpentierae]
MPDDDLRRAPRGGIATPSMDRALDGSLDEKVLTSALRTCTVHDEEKLRSTPEALQGLIEARRAELVAVKVDTDMATTRMWWKRPPTRKSPTAWRLLIGATCGSSPSPARRSATATG